MATGELKSGESTLDVCVVGGPRVIDVDRERGLTFGRSAASDLVIGPSDSSISRTAGGVTWTGAGWVVQNLSTSRPLYRIEGTGLRTPIAVGASLHVVDATTWIAVVGSILTHSLVVSLHSTLTPVRRELPSSGHTTDQALLTEYEFAVVVALVEGYLREPPRHEPRPRTYAEAADRLGISTGRMRKRIERAREKFVDAGVVELRQPDARLALAEFVLATKFVTSDHLALLDCPVEQARATRG